MSKKLNNRICVSMACLPMVLLSACGGGGGSSSAPSSGSKTPSGGGSMKVTPIIVSVTPNNSATGVDIDPTKIKLSLAFNEAMNPTLPLTAVKLVSTTASSQPIAITAANYDAASETYNMVISTASPLAYSTKYNIVVDPTEIKDANGNSMTATTPITYSFTTENNPVETPVTVPTIVSVTPNDGATAVDIDPTKIKLSLSFDEAMSTTLPLTAVKLVSTTAGSQPIAITAANYDAASETYNMAINTPLAYSTKYNIVVDPTEIKDANGNSMTATTPITYSFTTMSNPVVPPVTLPTIVSVTPNDGATSVDIDPTKIKLSLAFNEAMSTTLPLTAVKLISTAAGSQEIAITSASYDASSETYNMAINTPLAYSTKYNIVVDPTQIKDANGNSMTATAPITYSFTTITDPSTSPTYTLVVNYQILRDPVGIDVSFFRFTHWGLGVITNNGIGQVPLCDAFSGATPSVTVNNVKSSLDPNVNFQQPGIGVLHTYDVDNKTKTDVFTNIYPSIAPFVVLISRKFLRRITQ